MRESIAKKVSSPAYSRWLNTVILAFGSERYTRRHLDEMGVGLHTIAAARLNKRLIDNKLNPSQVWSMGLSGLLSLGFIGERSSLVMAHVLAEQGFDVFKWIGAKGRTLKGAVANARAKKTRRRQT